MSGLPYGRLSGFYFFYFALLGAYMPYWALYLKDRGFDPAQIGILTGAMMATKIVAPSLWGWLADKTGRRLGVIRLGSLLALVCFLGIFMDTGFAGLLLVIVAFSFFWNAVLSLFEVITLDHLGAAYHRYGQIRMWGSVGFIVVVAALGQWFELAPLSSLPWVMALLLMAIWVCSLCVSDAATTHRPERPGPLNRIVLDGQVISFFIVCLLVTIAHGPYNIFFTLYLESFGYDRGVIGWLWALGVIAEVVLFLVMYRLLPALGLRQLMLLSIALGGLRWCLLASLPESLWALVIAQCLHAASFGAFHAVCIEFIRRTFPSRFSGQGQAL